MDLIEEYADAAFKKPLKEQFEYIRDIESSTLLLDKHKVSIMEVINKRRRVKWHCGCYKYKKRADFYGLVNDTSLELEPYNPNTCIILWCGESQYFFTKKDIIGVFRKALLHADGLNWEPELPKNPYTNVEFNLGQLIGCCEFVRGIDDVVDLFRILRYDMNVFKKVFKDRGEKTCIYRYLFDMEQDKFDEMCDNASDAVDEFKKLYKETKDRKNLIPYLVTYQKKLSEQRSRQALDILNLLIS